MKHSLRITLLLTLLFFASQLIGLFIINDYLTITTTIVDGKTYRNATWSELPYDIQRPAFEEDTSFIPLILIVLIATGAVLLIVRFGLARLWKLWFFLSVWFCLLLAFNSFIPRTASLLISLLLAALKILKPHVLLHNLTELFIYGGLATVFVPVLNVMSILILLALISVYDMYAVWKSKHMIALATYQTQMKVFAGLLIPYQKKTAVLGGGDIGFPLLFAGVLLKTYGPLPALLVALTATLSLLILLFFSKKNTYYPAMPFLTLGCVAGYLLSLALSLQA